MIPEISVFFTAMLPFVDIKLAIPLGLKLGLSSISTFLFAVAGNMVPAAAAIFLLGPVSNCLRRRFKSIDHFFEKLFRKTRKEHSKKFERYGDLFLVIFVAAPLPGSGSFGGAVAAFIFGLDPWKSLTFITLGSSIAALFILGGFESFFAILNHFSS